MSKLRNAARILFMLTAVFALTTFIDCLFSAIPIGLTDLYGTAGTVLQLTSDLALAAVSLYAFFALKTEKLKRFVIFLVVYEVFLLAVGIFQLCFIGIYYEMDILSRLFEWIFALRDSYLPLFAVLTLLPPVRGKRSKVIFAISLILISICLIEELLLSVSEINWFLYNGLQLKGLITRIAYTFIDITFYTSLLLTAIDINTHKASETE